MEQAFGEDMAALAVCRKLDLVDGDEVGIELERHGLDGANVEARRGGLDLLLASDEGDLCRADAGDDLVVDLAREKPEGKSDDANVVGEHALDGEMGLAGVGRPEHRGDAASKIGRASCR